MGCDIHGVLQRKEDGKWITYAEGWPNRNYRFFGLLANVRNGYGPAGVETGDAIKPIAEPRGLPKGYKWGDHVNLPENFRWFFDGMREYHEKEKRYWLGDHSWSFVTGAELMELDLTKKIKCIGVLTKADFDKWEDNILKYREKMNFEYCGGVWGQNIVVMDESQYIERKKTGTLPEGKEIHVKTWWNERYAEAFGWEVMEWFYEIAKDCLKFGPKNIRFVFGFDN